MEDSITKLTILHSNDLHGDFLPKTVGGETGGLVRLSGYINKVRAEKENCLYVVAGDMFRGSIIDQEYQGLSTIDLMNSLRPDVATVGNHEVDYGLAHLLFLEKCARFPIINADLYVTMNSARLFQPYLNVEIGGLRVMFIGLLTEEVLASTRQEKIIVEEPAVLEKTALMPVPRPIVETETPQETNESKPKRSKKPAILEDQLSIFDLVA